MKAKKNQVKIGELKDGLSRFLRSVAKGEEFIVMDRSEPVAELIPIRDQRVSRKEQLIGEGVLRVPQRSWDSVKISRSPEPIDIQSVLRETRSE